MATSIEHRSGKYSLSYSHLLPTFSISSSLLIAALLFFSLLLFYLLSSLHFSLLSSCLFSSLLLSTLLSSCLYPALSSLHFSTHFFSLHSSLLPSQKILQNSQSLLLTFWMPPVGPVHRQPPLRPLHCLGNATLYRFRY